MSYYSYILPTLQEILTSKVTLQVSIKALNTDKQTTREVKNKKPLEKIKQISPHGNPFSLPT
jgi:hypothetical protein